MLGCGSVGQALLPLLFDHYSMQAGNLTVLADRPLPTAAQLQFKMTVIPARVTRDNYKDILTPHMRAGHVLLNLSVDVASVALIELCHELQVLYLDTSIEPWEGGYIDETLPIGARSNYALREAALALRSKCGRGSSTAVLAHGANPGLVSHFLKRALLNIAKDTGVHVEKPATQAEWAALARQLNVKAVHISEKDTQVSHSVHPKQREFFNTWSVDGFVSEGAQPAELGWGTHERHFPHDGQKHENGCGAAIFLERPGMLTRVRTWAPHAGPFHGFLVTHNEAISISDFLTVRDGSGEAVYRPTSHYSYLPCPAALQSIHDFVGNNFTYPASQRVLKDELAHGRDELGVLVMGHARGAYWYGSDLTLEDARARAPFNNATSLQVAVGVLAALDWMLQHPEEGIVEPEQIDHDFVIELAELYLGKLVGAYTDWTPLAGRSRLFPEPEDPEDPWQFINIRVS